MISNLASSIAKEMEMVKKKKVTNFLIVKRFKNFCEFTSHGPGGSKKAQEHSREPPALSIWWVSANS